MLTKASAVELAPYNIRVNGIAPGAVRTRFFEGLFAHLAGDLVPPEGEQRDGDEEEETASADEAEEDEFEEEDDEYDDDVEDNDGI